MQSSKQFADERKSKIFQMFSGRNSHSTGEPKGKHAKEASKEQVRNAIKAFRSGLEFIKANGGEV